MTAVIYPEILSTEILGDPKRRAEVLVYNKLRDSLPDGFHVFYNCDWLDKSGKGTTEDGEADFIIAHENFGFITLEVKGGIISRDEKTHQWYSRGSGGKTYEIKDPVKQARISKHVILNKLKDLLGDKLGFIRTKHAVIFPDSGKPKSGADLGADMPLDIFMFQEDMPTLGTKVFKILMNTPSGSNTSFSSLGRIGIDAITKMFSQGFTLEVSLSSKIKSCEFKILEATTEQNKVLKHLDQNNKMSILGGAGTGKTSLAVEKARQLSLSGKSVLLLCFNAPLAKYLKHILTSFDKVDVYTYHGLCQKYASESGHKLPNIKSDKYNQELPYFLIDAAESLSTLKYDSIIVDEGQDFDSEWIESLSSCLKNPETGIFYFFYDDNQRIYKKYLQNYPAIPKQSFRLFENIRNTKPIFSASKNFYNGGALESLGPEGLAIEWIEIAEDQRNRRLENILNKLKNNEGIASSEIAVLTAKSYENYPNLAIGGHLCCRADDLGADKITLDSIHRFKGLEREVIILVDLNTVLANVQLLYVGFSRARSLLIIMDTPEAIKSLKAQVAVLN